MQDLRKPQLLLVAITLAALAPFLNKAFHIDDPLFLWMAQQIAQHPLDPYGFSVNWASFPEPMWQQMQNPPLCSYFIAAVAWLVGWSESALHSAFLFWATMSVLGTFAIARRFCREPFIAALLTLFTPVFLISATNVMCDVMLLALWVWSIELWLAGLERNKWSMSIFAALLVGAAVLTKYFGIALVPLLAVYTILRDRKQWPRLILFLIPIGVAWAYEFWTKSLYGHGLFTAAIFFARGASKTFGQAAPAQILVGLAFTGGCLIAPIFYLWLWPQGATASQPSFSKFRRLGSRRSLTLGIIAMFVLVLTAFYFLVPIDPQWALGPNVFAVRIEGGIFAAIGLGFIAMAAVDLARNRDTSGWFLMMWVIGTFAFTTFFNWSITARTVLPMVPAAAILLVRAIGRDGSPSRPSNSSDPAVAGEKRPYPRLALHWRVAAIAIVSIVVAAADYRQANSARAAARAFAERFRAEPGKVWFQSHWGFQYYMEQSGATPLNSRDSEITSGDIMIIPANNTLTIAIPREKVFTPEDVNFSVLPLISTMGRGTGASFYSSIRGPIPWAIDRVPPEMYYVARFR